MSITIDKEFESLIPPLSPEEFQQLEENCVKEGIRDALITWNGILIDGHNRFKIAAKHGLLWNEKRMEFADRDEAKIWIYKNQLGRRNIAPFVRAELALKLKPAIAEKAKERQATHTEQGYQKSDKAEHTAKELAKIAGVSHDTIHKVETILKNGDKEVIDKARKQEISINQAYRSAMNIPPVPPKIDLTKEAEKRHEQFEQAKEEKTVDFQAAISDKDDVVTIARSMALEIESSMTKMLNVKRLGSVDVDNIRKVERTKESKDNFRRQLRDCIKLLIHLERILNDW